MISLFLVERNGLIAFGYIRFYCVIFFFKYCWSFKKDTWTPAERTQKSMSNIESTTLLCSWISYNIQIWRKTWQIKTAQTIQSTSGNLKPGSYWSYNHFSIKNSNQSLLPAVLYYSIYLGFGRHLNVSHWTLRICEFYHPEHVSSLNQISMSRCGSRFSRSWFCFNQTVKLMKRPTFLKIFMRRTGRDWI